MVVTGRPVRERVRSHESDFACSETGTGISTRAVLVLVVIAGGTLAVITLGLFTWALSSGRPLAEAMTMTFAALVLIELFGRTAGARDERSVPAGRVRHGRARRRRVGEDRR